MDMRNLLTSQPRSYIITVRLKEVAEELRIFTVPTCHRYLVSIKNEPPQTRKVCNQCNQAC